MTVTIPSTDLHRMVYNSILYTSKKSAAGPVVRWTMNESGLWLTASDDYFILTDVHHQDFSPDIDQIGHDFWVGLDQMKQLEKELRDTSGDLGLVTAGSYQPEQDTAPGGELTLLLDNDETLTYPFEEDVDTSGWGHAARILSMQDFIDQSDSGTGQAIFAIHPDRLRKLSLVKPGEYPIDCRYGWNNRYARDMIHFKIGPTVRGVFAPLDREIITEALAEKGDMLW